MELGVTADGADLSNVPKRQEEIPITALYSIKVLAVDDDDMNLEVLNHILAKNGFEVVNAGNGMEAIKYLEQHPDDIDIILLDKMMPKLNGIDTLKRIKKHPKLKNIPVIMQTAAVAPENMIEGINTGVYYYLTKPFDDSMLLSLVNAAARDGIEHKKINEEVKKSENMMQMIKHCEFEFKSIDQAKVLAMQLANYFPKPGKVVIGLTELMINAVEHGNLNIGYQKKIELITMGICQWEGEVQRRMELPENKDKKVTVSLDRDQSKIIITITDQGAGFNWKEYKDFDPLRMTEPSGRGIAKANIMAFDSIDFLGLGNQITCIVDLNKAGDDEDENF